MTIRLLVLAVLLSLPAAAAVVLAADGILIVQRVTSGGAPLTVRMQIEATRFRTEMADPNGVINVTIVDVGKQALYVVDPARKTYMEMTKAAVDRLSAQLPAAMAEMKAQLGKLAPEQRAQMEALMTGSGQAAVPQYTRTGSDKVGRWTCDQYEVTQNGQKIGEVCTVNPATLGFVATDFDVMRQLGALYSAMAPQMTGQLPSVSGIDQRGSSDFAVKTVMVVQGQTVTTEVIEASRQTFADSLFAVPAGFTKQDVPGPMGRIGPGR